ncbi:DUF6286 domain-containing protein [Streptomyces sp. NBC_01754]|uniref:DUF6286 domain-containing protein n=1 Tax=Streptomyces sp. NBC_01754 TaxID=2975930 RepID=UPI002DD8991F|nr:DUF6286 domain-containing protein [Streptomyces sp. NBC_01754]WSC91794.1 DUF6286 domain-containing protein [Streptomyces sp. NBC_01754]
MSEPQDPLNTTRRLPTAGSEEPPAASGGVLEADRSEPGRADEAAPERPGGRAGRFRSGRRVSAAVVALLLFGGSGLLLYDIAAVRAGRPAMAWRRSLADELATRHLDDVWVLAGSAAAAAVGLWLLLLALTPGLRALLPMRREHAGVRAALYRDAAALVLRDRAAEVAGVQSVRVKVRRRKAKVAAVSHFRELDDVRGDLDTVLGTGIRELGLARPPRPSVRVRRPKKG